MAKRILDGELPGSGNLARVSADGLPNLNRIDTTTSNWAIQVKHQRDSGNMGVSSFGSSNALPQSEWPPGWTLEANGPYRGWMQYFDQMVVQAGAGRIPCVVLNRNPTPALESALFERGIIVRILED